MKPNELANHYDKLADHWNSHRFNRANGIQQHQRAFQYAMESGSAIDIGCGSSGRIIDLLLKQGFETKGLDYSSEMLKHAQARHPDTTFYHADICEWTFDEKFSFISAWDSIWHVPLNQQESVLKKLFNALAPEGVIIFTSGAVNEPGEATNPFLGQPLYHAALGIPAILALINESNCTCRHLENDDWPDRHLYIIAQKNT